MRVSEIVKSDISTWENGDIITIKAGTGVGKSHFIKNELYEFAKKDNKKILMLIHRRNCVDQFQNEIIADGKTDVVDIETYQYVDTRNRDKQRFDFDFSPYSYIVADEWHYFFNDSKFNSFTDISFNAILNQTDTIRIFMSATGDYMQRYINKHKGLATIDYEIPIDFNFIERLHFFHKNETLEAYIERAIKNNKKAIFFVYSAKQAYELHKKFKDHTLFNCGKGSKYYQHVNKEKINSMLHNERFEELILITTTVMDAGVNIKDDMLNNIVVCDVHDIGTLIQCIGRKRLKTDEKIILHIKALGNQQLGGMETKARKEVEKANFFREYGATDYNDKYYRTKDKSNIVYKESIGSESNVELKLNELMFFKIVTEIQEIEAMKKFKSINNYCEYMKQLFGIVEYKIHKEEGIGDDLKSYLESIVGQKLNKEKQVELKEVFKKNGLNARTLGINTLNGNLKDSKMPFIIEIGDRKSYRDENGKVKKENSYWIIGKIVFR